MNIYVSNLGYSIGDEDLKNLFTAFGNVAAARIITDKVNNRSKGFGFVDMPDETEGQKAIRELNGAMTDGRSLKVSEAKPRESRNSGFYSGRR